MFSDFDFSVLDDPEFKEDSVREELIQPLIRALGYQVSGNVKVIRSRTLKHPFVSIGSTKHKISIVPDYVFEIDGKIHWILDAKSPVEEITKSKHVEQAYSYAIHPEIRSSFYALCNGKEFVLYETRKDKPILSFKMIDIASNFDLLRRLLDSNFMANPEVVDYIPDYGLTLTKMGVEPGFLLVALQVNTDFVAKIQDGYYTTSTEFLHGKDVEGGEIIYTASFDFDEKLYRQLLSFFDAHKASIVQKSLSRQPFMINLKEDQLQFGICAVLGSNVFNNAEESYVPFNVIKFTAYGG